MTTTRRILRFMARHETPIAAAMICATAYIWTVIGSAHLG